MTRPAGPVPQPRRGQPAGQKAGQKAGHQVSVAVDMIRCDGHGICAWLLPDRISLDRWGYPVVDPEPLPASDERRARRAVKACPRGAISVTGVH